MRMFHVAALLFVASAGAAGCSSMSAPLQTASHVDLPKYMGDWYVIANIPYFAEKNCFDSVESYSLRADGKIDNWFTCRNKSFDAPMKRKASALITVDDKASNATWSVKFFKFFSVKYLILAVDPNYQWALVGHPSRRYGWIFARSKTLTEDTYRQLLRQLSDQGYDAEKFSKVPQRGESAGSEATNPIR